MPGPPPPPAFQVLGTAIESNVAAGVPAFSASHDLAGTTSTKIDTIIPGGSPPPLFDGIGIDFNINDIDQVVYFFMKNAGSGPVMLVARSDVNPFTFFPPPPEEQQFVLNPGDSVALHGLGCQRFLEFFSQYFPPAPAKPRFIKKIWAQAQTDQDARIQFFAVIADQNQTP